MKKLFTLFCFSIIACQSLFANAGIYETYTSFSENGGSPFFRGTGGSNPAFAGSSLGTNINPNTGTLVMLLRGFNAFADNSSVISDMGATVSYRVYKDGTMAPAYTTISLTKQGESGNNKFFNDNLPSINLLAGVTGTGTYNVEIQFDAVTNGVNCTNPISRNARQLGSIATFTTNVVLATDLLDFKAIKQSGNVQLSWLTGTPKDDNQFSIERSKEGVNFDALSTIQATQKSASKGNYSFSDAAPFKGINYYRLKSMDNAGASTYSKVIAVDFSKRISVSIYPNPASGKTTLDINSEKEDNILIQVTDVVGRLHRSFNQAVVQGNNAISLDAASLPNGVYFIRLNDEVQKFIKN